jgi:hypothetical protein
MMTTNGKARVSEETFDEFLDGQGLLEVCEDQAIKEIVPVSVDIKLAKEAIYLRGLFINRYSGIEFAIAELVSRAARHDAYSDLGPPPFGPAKKLKRLIQIVERDGPIASYRDQLLPSLDEFAQYEDYRHFMAHAIMMPTSPTDISFKMYDHREGIYSVGELQFGLKHFEDLANLISSISTGFTSLVAKICRAIPLPAV